MNLTDWLGDHAWALWFGLAFLLAVAEIMSLDLVLIMLAAGAVAGGATAVIAPGAWWLQVLVAIIVSVGSLMLLRPTLMRRVREMPGYRSSTAKMIGSTGVATAEINRDSGEVKVDGQTWSARAYDRSMVIEKGTEVEVFEIDGPIAVVYPAHEPLA